MGLVTSQHGDLPRSWIEPMSAALAGGLITAEPPAREGASCRAILIPMAQGRQTVSLELPFLFLGLSVSKIRQWGFYVGSAERSLCPRVLLPLYLSYYLLRWREAGGPLASIYNF